MKKIDTFFMSEKQIEQMKRKKKWNKKMTISAILILSSIASGIALGYVPEILLSSGVPSLSVEYIELILGGIAGLGSIGGFATLSKTLHDPLTPKEAEELAEKDAIEKGGYSK